MRLTIAQVGVLLGVLASMLLPAAVPASAAADNVSIQVFLESGNQMASTNGLSFRIVAEVESSAGVIQPITIRIALPAGLRWGTDGPDPGEGCTVDNPAVCSTATSMNGVGTVGGGYVWDVIADRAGRYEITASVTTTEPDPDTSDNTHTFGFDVVAPPGGGGGGGGGGVVSASASAAKVSPAKPKAGTVVTASVRVSAGGTPVRPTAIACAATIGAAKLKGSGKAASGTATCAFRTPKAAKGKTLRGSVSFTARGERFTKRFAAKLG